MQKLVTFDTLKELKMFFEDGKKVYRDVKELAGKIVLVYEDIKEDFEEIKDDAESIVERLKEQFENE